MRGFGSPARWLILRAMPGKWPVWTPTDFDGSSDFEVFPTFDAARAAFAAGHKVTP